MSSNSTVLTANAPPPAGHYAQARIGGGHIYISGQLPIRPDGEPLTSATFEAQAEQALDNMLKILAAAGASPGDLLKVTAYIVGVGNWAPFNAAYARRLPYSRPARTIVPVTELHYGYLVEVDAIALAPHRPSSGERADIADTGDGDRRDSPLSRQGDA